MTALAQYARLECPGLWRADPGAQRVESVVSFGEASLVITDHAGRVLSHWSLAAVERINPTEMPALFTPTAEAAEVLEIGDETMVEAIETVRNAVAGTQPHGGRLRRITTALVLLAGAGLAALWLPGALARHTESVLPRAAIAEIEANMIEAVTRVAGAPCKGQQAERALQTLAQRLLPTGSRFLVVPGGDLPTTVLLPNGTTLISRTLVEDHETPDVLAGTILAAHLTAKGPTPLVAFLLDAGPLATLRLLTSGHLPLSAFTEWAETLSTLEDKPLAEADIDALLQEFARVQVASTPYAYALDVTGETVLPMIEGDPMRGTEAPPLLTARDWTALQDICMR